jgi:TP901-1 family phage major tail protein
MAKSLGRDAKLYVNNALLAAIRTKNFAINNAPVDVSDDDSATWRELWEVPGQKTVEFGAAGLLKDTALMTIAMQTNSSVEDAEFLFSDYSILSGNFFLASFSVAGEYNNASTFEVKLQSAGTVLFSASVSATYGRSTTTVTVTKTTHGLATSDIVRITTASGAVTLGKYTITRLTADTFSFTDTASGTITAGTACTYTKVQS